MDIPDVGDAQAVQALGQTAHLDHFLAHDGAADGAKAHGDAGHQRQANIHELHPWAAPVSRNRTPPE